MLKEVKRYEWEDFLATVKAHYRQLGYDLEIMPRPGAEGFRLFRLTRRDDGTVQSLDNPGAYQALADALFPGRAVSVLSVYKPKEAFLGNDVIYIAVEPSSEQTTGEDRDSQAPSAQREAGRPLP